MRKFLKSAGLPIGVFALAIGSAFATNAMKEIKDADPIYPQPYYYHDLASQQCVMIEDEDLNCTEINSGLGACTWSANNVFGKELGGTACSVQLYKPRP